MQQTDVLLAFPVHGLICFFNGTLQFVHPFTQSILQTERVESSWTNTERVRLNSEDSRTVFFKFFGR
jgi:hypothetical protein